MSLPKFDIQKLPRNGVIMIVGKRAVGKTTLVKDILYQYRDIPIKKIVSPFHHEDKYNNTPIYRDYSQLNMRDSPESILVLEDFSCADNWRDFIDLPESNIFQQAKDNNVMTILTSQIHIDLRPNWLGSVFIFRDDVATNRKQLYEYCIDIFPSFEAFSQAMDELEDHECIVVNYHNAWEPLVYKSTVHEE